MQLLEAIERPSAYGQTPAVVLIGTNSESFGSKLSTTIQIKGLQAIACSPLFFSVIGFCAVLP
jgi:hypothetical protein